MPFPYKLYGTSGSLSKITIVKVALLLAWMLFTNDVQTKGWMFTKKSEKLYKFGIDLILISFGILNIKIRLKSTVVEVNFIKNLYVR